jgi:hypothetical protein
VFNLAAVCALSGTDFVAFVAQTLSASSTDYLISDLPQFVIPGRHSGTRNPENQVEKALDSGFCPCGQPRNDGV